MADLTSVDVLMHPGTIVLNGVPYQVATKDPKTSELEWDEQPVINGSEPKPGPGLTHTRVPGTKYAWISEQVLDSWHMGLGDILLTEPGTYHWGDNVDGTEPGQVILGPLRTELTIAATAGGDPVGFFELGGRMYAIWSRYIREIGTLSGTPTDTADVDFGAGEHVSDVKIFRNAAMVALGGADAFQSRATGAAPGTYTAADSTLTADYFAVTEAFLYRADADGSNTRVVSCPTSSSPLTAANWSSEIDVGGDSGVSFTDLESFGYQVLVGKRDGVYNTNRLGFTPNMLEELKEYVDAANGRGMHRHGGMMYIPHLRGLIRYDGGGSQTVGLEKLQGHGHTNLGPINGVYRALTSDGTWLYVAVWNGTDTYILKYKEIVRGESVLGVWHNLGVWAANQVTGMHVTGLSGTNPSLWLASTTNELVSRYFLPASSKSPIQDTGYTYAASGTIYMGKLYMGSDVNNKVFTEVTIEGDNLAVGAETLTMSYRTSAAVPWVTTGFTATTAVTSSPTTLTLNAAGRFLETNVALARGSTTTKTPVLRRMLIRCIQFVDFMRHITVKVLLTTGPQVLEGAVMAENIQTTEGAYAVLRALENSTTALTLKDPFGSTRTVYVVDPITVETFEGLPGEEAIVIATIHLVEQ